MNKNKKMRDWYFEGYEIKTVVKNGKTKRVYGDYKGKYYSLGMDAAELRAFRILYYSLCAIYLAVYFFISLQPSYAAATWPGMFNLVNIIPIIYLIIGSVYFITAKPEMTLRTVYSSVKTIIRSLYAILIFSILTVVSDIYVAGKTGDIFGENTVFLAGSLVCAAITVVLVMMWRRHPCEEVNVKKDKS